MRSLESLKLLNMAVCRTHPRFTKLWMAQYVKRGHSTYKPNTGSALIAISDKIATNKMNSKQSSTDFGLLRVISPLTNTVTFGVAKDRSPVKQTKKYRTNRDEPIVRYDTLYLKKGKDNGVPDLSRNYKQTWTEFPQGRVRPVTEWGSSQTRKRS